MFTAVDFMAVRLALPNSVGTTIVVTIVAIFASDLFRVYFKSLGNEND
jgi:hypothetical protein